MKTLIVDDNEEVCETLKTFIELKFGFPIYVANTFKVGLEKFELLTPELAFLDVHLPDGTGLELLHKLAPKSPLTSFIMITAYKDAEAILAAFRDGAVDCLLKPFNFEYLASLIVRLSHGA